MVPWSATDSTMGAVGVSTSKSAKTTSADPTINMDSPATWACRGISIVSRHTIDGHVTDCGSRNGCALGGHLAEVEGLGQDEGGGRVLTRVERLADGPLPSAFIANDGRQIDFYLGFSDGGFVDGDGTRNCG